MYKKYRRKYTKMTTVQVYSSLYWSAFQELKKQFSFIFDNSILCYWEKVTQINYNTIRS